MTSTSLRAEVVGDVCHEVGEAVARDVQLGDHLGRPVRRAEMRVERAVVPVLVVAPVWCASEW